MNTSRVLRYAAAASLTALLAACASTGPSVSGSWKEIGTTSNGNIKASIDTASIKRNGSLATFRDKKTVLKPSEERYVNTPAYKTAVGEWEIHCTNRTYRLTALQLLDEHGKVLMNERYTAAGLRPMSVMSGSITEKQFEAVCK